MEIRSDAELVDGRIMYRSLPDFRRACCVYIETEQHQVSPDNTLLALLCDAVRLSRETEDLYGPSTIGRRRSAPPTETAT